MTTNPTGTRLCPTCPAEANPAHFGGCCDTCEARRRERADRIRLALATAGDTSPLARALGAAK